MTVRCVSVVCLGGAASDDLTLRSLRVVVPGKTDAEGFLAMHYAYNCWPDHAAPRETRSVRSLMQAVNQARKGLSAQTLPTRGRRNRAAQLREARRWRAARRWGARTEV